MFGYVVLSSSASKEDKKKYREAYCGLCHTLKEMYGKTGVVSLSYDMTFLSLLLSDIEDSPVTEGEERCVVHPIAPHKYFTTPVMEYTAAMQILLSHYALIDDNADEGKEKKNRFLPFIPEIEKKYPRQSNAIKTRLQKIWEKEKKGEKDAEGNALLFGEALGEIFVNDEQSHFAPDLRLMGCGIGRFIYLLDAWDDRKKDGKKGRYNPLPPEIDEDEMRNMLIGAASTATMAMDHMPLDDYVPIFENILYSGMWSKFRGGKEQK
ncbi:MAG: DUF5685 family protein [Candidatus Ornithospirochaeta sp.]